MTATTTIQTPPCPVCRTVHSLEVPTDGIIAYQNGSLIQEAFPDLNYETRETMISGTCPACWDALWGAED